MRNFWFLQCKKSTTQACRDPPPSAKSCINYCNLTPISRLGNLNRGYYLGYTGSNDTPLIINNRLIFPVYFSIHSHPEIADQLKFILLWFHLPIRNTLAPTFREQTIAIIGLTRGGGILPKLRRTIRKISKRKPILRTPCEKFYLSIYLIILFEMNYPTDFQQIF